MVESYMRSILVAAALAVLSPAQKAEFVVHEWGTFTSVQGSDGSILEGLQHEEESLPDFVHARAAITNDHGKGLTMPAIHVTQKMETPVMYFYTPEKMNVHVRVEFDHGLITQWYPRASSVEPVAERKPFDISQVQRSSAQWDVELIPFNDQRSFAAVDKSRGPVVPWEVARNVKAASVRAAGETEDYIFYRGFGNFTLPVLVNAGAIQNAGIHDLPAAFALEITPSGGRFSVLGRIAAGRSADLSLENVELAKVETVVAKLKSKMHAVLVAEGLFPDEAAAMVNTWSRQWFSSPGTRVIYIVPREKTDHLLPLEITPSPATIVRVLVGRLEYFTPDQEVAAIRALSNPNPQDQTGRDAWQKLYGAGRFVEPLLRRAMALSRDASVQQVGEQLIQTLRPIS